MIMLHFHVMTSGTLEARDLRLVQAIAESGGVTPAAKRLHLSQSAVSHQLRGLESRLGIELFRREGNRLQISAAGRKLVTLAHQILPTLIQTELDLKRSSIEVRRQLRVATQCNTAYHWLPRVFSALAFAHPEVDLVLTSEVLGDPSEALEADHLDLALCIAPPKRKSFLQLPLFEDELMLAVPRGHALSRKAHVDGRDLASETLIQTMVSPLERDRVGKLLFGNAKPRFARVLRLPTIEGALELVQAGMGVSILAGFILTSRIARGDIQAVRLTRRGLVRSWSGVFRKGSPIAAPIRTTLDQLQRFGPPRQPADVEHGFL